MHNTRDGFTGNTRAASPRWATYRSRARNKSDNLRNCAGSRRKLLGRGRGMTVGSDWKDSTEAVLNGGVAGTLPMGAATSRASSARGASSMASMAKWCANRGLADDMASIARGGGGGGCCCSGV